ncbi:MAG: RNA polymerase sigma factor [Planctomycetota bacterium]|jgi:hypothetical protein
MIEDKLLMWKLKCGSNDALCRIYEKYKDNLLRHDCFVAFAQSTEKLKLSGHLKSYLATCVVNRARNWNRSRQRNTTTDLNETESAISNTKRPEQWIISLSAARGNNSARPGRNEIQRNC